MRTRQQLFAPIAAEHLSPRREFCELDLNGDGIDELILSQSVSLGGTGGLVFDLYLGLGDNRFRLVDSFLSGALAVEKHERVTRLWSYSHSSSQSGSIQYRYFDRKGDLIKSPALLVFPGDGGTKTGNGIVEAIFRPDTRLETKTIGTSNKAAAP